MILVIESLRARARLGQCRGRCHDAAPLRLAAQPEARPGSRCSLSKWPLALSLASLVMTRTLLSLWPLPFHTHFNPKVVPKFSPLKFPPFWRPPVRKVYPKWQILFPFLYQNLPSFRYPFYPCFQYPFYPSFQYPFYPSFQYPLYQFPIHFLSEFPIHFLSPFLIPVSDSLFIPVSVPALARAISSPAPMQP